MESKTEDTAKKNDSTGDSWRIFEFNAERNLFSLPIVKHIFWITSTLAVIVAGVIASNTESKCGLSADCINAAVDDFKLPLAILAVGLTLIGMCGANHRSEQTRRQISRTDQQIALTQQQNLFSNHFKNIEEFDKYCDKHSDETYEIVRTRLLYRKLYPNSRQGDYQTSDYASHLDNALKRFPSKARWLDAVQLEDYQRAIFDLARFLHDLMEKFHLSYASKPEGLDLNIGNTEGTYFVPDYNPQSLVRHITLAFQTANEILQFDINYTERELCQVYLAIDLLQLPTHRMTLDPAFPAINFQAILEAAEKQIWPD